MFPIDVEDTANVIVEYDNGMTAIIEAGWEHPFLDGPEGAIQVFGTAGYARTQPPELHCNIEGAWGQYRPCMPPRRRHGDRSMYIAQMAHFIACVLDGEEPIPGGRQGLRAMTVVEAAYRSAESGASVSLPEEV
jgi:glucose-fructose oxidoreductase